ncbi:MAG TPA: CHAP domain-containing protein [Candidatus Saccharimonadia bacterium]|nr:CHAP domain-containing protein [Candidatus Saccharimonadia bacterium]
MQIPKINSTKFISIIFAVLSIFILSSYSLVGAEPNDDLQSILNNTAYYDPSISTCGSDGGVGLPSIGSSVATSGAWHSGKTAPYFLEEFAIQTLEDVAQKTNTPVSSVVTQEHVIALIAWFWSEGGDIADGPPSSNPDPNLFNPLNTSIQDPALESTNAGGGLESFKSFDAGVEGTARTMVGSYQDRIAAILTHQYSTAEQVMETIANFQNYPGNKAWASPPGNPTLAEVIADNQNSYLPSLLANVSQVRTNYVSEATTMMGTPNAEELIPKDHVPTSDLTYQPTASSTTGISTSSSNQPDSSASSSGCDTNISCNNTSPTTASSSQLSQIRQNVVCIATNELKEHWSGNLTPQDKQYYLTYTQGRPEEWCADFASWVYNEAKYPLQGGGSWSIPAVATIQSIGEANQNFHWHAAGTGYIPKPGDLAIHGGSHVNIVVAVNGMAVTYIGGDQGSGPYGGSDSGSVVSYDNEVGYYNAGITGYVSPD